MKFFLLLLAMLNTVCLYAHQDFNIIKDYGNIKVRIQTGYDYEEVNKIEIIGQLADRLANELEFEQQVFLDFIHMYTEVTRETLYFVSFDDGTFYNNDNLENEKLFDNDILVIRQFGNLFNIEKTLKLLEYSLKNENEIKREQKKVIYKTQHLDLELNSIEKSHIEKIKKSENSKEFQSLLQLKTYRPDDKFVFGFTYYWQNGKFKIVKIGSDKSENILFELDNLYEFRLVGNCTFIFPTKNEFITVNYSHNKSYQKMVSELLKIEGGENNYRPYKIEFIGGNKFSIYFNSKEGKENLLIYDEVKNNILTIE